MLKTLVTEKKEQSKFLLQGCLKNIEDIELCGAFSSLDEINVDLDDIDLILFDIEFSNSDEILSKITSLKEKHKNLNFIAMSYEVNSELVSKTLKEGVRDFLLKPVIQGILDVSIDKIRNIKNEIPFNLSKAISVFSGKGGIGKTSFAINVAYELSNLTEERVCLLDLSSSAGDIATYLNQKPKFPADYVISKIETSDKDLLLSMINQYENKNFYFLSDNVSKTKFTPERIQKLVASLKNIFPYVVIDTPNNLDETTLAVLSCCDLILMLGLSSMVSLKNSKMCLELFNEIGYNSEKIKFIINRYTENTDINVKEIETTLKKEVFYKVPNNYLTLSDAINQGHAVSKLNPQSNIARAYKNIASEILNSDFPDTNENNAYKFNHGIFNLLRRMGE